MPVIVLAIFVIALRLLAAGYMLVVLVDVVATVPRQRRAFARQWGEYVYHIGPRGVALLKGVDVSELEQVAAEYAAYMDGQPLAATTSRVVRAWRAIRPSTYLFPEERVSLLRSPRTAEALKITQTYFEARGIHMSQEQLRALIAEAEQEVHHAARPTR